MDSWPIYFKDRLIIRNTTANIAIATLWTPKEMVEKLVSSDKVSIIGQLYTKKGINYLLRNILANPYITKLYLVGSDLMESGEAMLRLKNEGVDEDHKIIGDSTAEVEKEIDFDAINLFRKNVEIIDMRGNDKLNKIAEAINAEVVLDFNLWSEPKIFSDPPKPEVSVFPSEIDLVKIRRNTIAEAYPVVLKHIMMFGLESKPIEHYVSDTSNKLREVLNLSVVIQDEDPKKWSIPEYMPFSEEDLDNYFKGFFDPDVGSEDYTYGERLFNYSHAEIDELKKIYPWLAIERFKKFFPTKGIDQVAIGIVRKLKNFPYDKGAIALLGNPYTDVFPQRPPKKIPCLFMIQCQIYQNKLNLTAYFRSNDMYNAWPLNAFALRKLQADIADKLEVGLGPLITISNMAHIYEHNYGDAQQIIDKNYQGTCGWDERGNFMVAVEGNEVVVRQMSPDGNLELHEWRQDALKPKAGRDLCYAIETDMAISLIGNALDLGRQIERAITAVKLNLSFMQDNPLDFSSIKK